MSGKGSVVPRCRQSMVASTNQNIRNVNRQAAAPIQLRLDRDRRHSSVVDANDADGATRTRPEFGSPPEDSSQDTPAPSSFETSQDFVARRRPAFNNDGGNDGREHFVFPDPLSPVTKRGTPSDVTSAEPTESSSSENTITEAEVAAEFCGSPQEKKSNKSKGIARDPAPTTNPEKPAFLPLLKKDSLFPRQSEHEKQTQKPRYSSFHSKLANLNRNPASAKAPEAPRRSARSRDAERDQKTLRHLRLQTMIQSDQIKHLKFVTKDLAEALNRLQVTTARDIQVLNENSESQRENSDRLVSAWKGMRRELLELKVRMAHENLRREAVSRDGDEDGDWDRRRPVPDLPFPPPHSLLQPTPMEYAFSTGTRYISPFDSCYSNPPPPMAVITPNNLPSMPGAVNADPSFSNAAPVSHSADRDVAYSAVPLQYWDHYRESHILQNPQGCRWHYCSVCRGGGERVTGFE
jgi:hypothetical protein